MFNERLRELRKKKKLTQAELAKELGVSVSGIQSYEQGKREPNNDMLIKIADYFNTDTDYLIGRDRKNIAGDEEKLLTILRSMSKEERNKTLKSLITLLSK